MKLGKSNAFRLTELHTVMMAVFVFALGAAITLMSVNEGLPIPAYSPDASPFGYTWSLSLIWLPIVILALWFRKSPDSRPQSWKAFTYTVCILTPVWTILDMLAAPSIFQFPNCYATMQIYIPGWIPGQGFTGLVPIEEVFFYLGSCILTLMVYIWGSMYFFKKQTVHINQADARDMVPLIKFDWKVLAFGTGILLLTFVYKHFHWDGSGPTFPPALENCRVPIPDMSGRGIPLYFTILWALAFVPAVLIWHKAWKFVNVGALIFTIVSAILFSLLWEATLALPYGWWNYNPRWMMGIFIPPWHNLPLEAVVLWLLASWGVVLIYEFFSLIVATRQSIWVAALGKKISDDN